MSKKLTSFVLRLKKSHSWPVRNVSTVLAIFLLRSFTKLPKRKSLFQFQREEQRKKLKLYDPPSPQWCWIKIEKLHLEKAARPLMVCFLAATADEYLRATLKCIQIQKYGLSESVNSTTFSTCVCVCVGGDWNEGQTLNMQKIISLQLICEATGGMFGTMMATGCCVHIRVTNVPRAVFTPSLRL